METLEGVMLKPTQLGPSMVKKQGLWVHTGKLPPGFDIAQAIRDDREDRIRKLAPCEGLSRYERSGTSLRSRAPAPCSVIRFGQSSKGGSSAGVHQHPWLS